MPLGPPRRRRAVAAASEPSGDRVCHWREGEALIFDDAYEHEAWNHSDGVRVVLFVDFENRPAFPPA